MFSADEHFMRLALAIAETGQGQTSPNPMVGCVLVQDGLVVGQGAHLRAGEAHAEVHALTMAGSAAKGCTAYVTLEPCSHFGRTPPCADALIQAGVARVVVALTDVDPRVNGGGIRKLREAGVEVTVGVLEEEALRQNEVFVTWVQKRRPFVLWKCAATLDGYVAASTGHSQYVTGEAARQRVQFLRRSYAAIGVGVGTVVADDPRLTVHGQGGSQPVRVIFDSVLRTPPTSRMFQEPGRTLVFHTASASERDRAQLTEAGVELVEVSADVDHHVEVSEVLAFLGNQGLNSLFLEGGPQLAGTFLQQRLVDKVAYFIAPKLLGGGFAALGGRHTVSMNEAVSLERVTTVQDGPDVCVIGYPVYEGEGDHVHRVN